MPDAAIVADLRERIAACQSAITEQQSDRAGYRQCLAEELCPFKKYDIVEMSFPSTEATLRCWVKGVRAISGGFLCDVCLFGENGSPLLHSGPSVYHGNFKADKKIGRLTPEQIQQIEEQA